MVNDSVSFSFSGLLKTFAILIVFEILSSSVLPILGIHQFKPAFSVLVVLYFAFKLDDPVLPFLILFTQFIHAGFSIDGWALGTMIGILIATLVRYTKDMLSFSNPVSTIIVVQVFQIFWFIIFSLLVTTKMGDFSQFFFVFFKYLPESIFISLISPSAFKLFDRFWKVGQVRGSSL